MKILILYGSVRQWQESDVSAHDDNRPNQRLDTYIRGRRGTWANSHRVRPEWY
ncbi:hypothetical protein ACVW19_003815 [Streptomyces sp. TE5632]